MYSFFSYFRPQAERRLLGFGLETSSGPEEAPERQANPEEIDSLRSLDDVHRTGQAEIERGNRDTERMVADLTMPEGVDSPSSEDVMSALTTEPLRADDALSTSDASAEALEDVSSESQEQAGQTPQQKLWAEFIELGRGLDNPDRSDRLEEVFMAIPNDRAEAMLQVYDDMNVEERARFDGIIVANSALLKDFSDEGFEQATALLTANSNDERILILQQLPQSDQDLIALRWSQDNSVEVSQHFHKVDEILRQSNRGQEQSSETAEENIMTLQEEIDAIEDPLLRNVIQALITILEAVGMGAEQTNETNTDERRRIERGVDAELRNVQGEEREQKRLALLNEANTSRQNLRQDLTGMQSALENAQSQEPVDAEEVQRIAESIHGIERSLQEQDIRIARLEALAPNDQPEQPQLQLMRASDRIVQLQQELPENERNFSVETIDVDGESRMALVFNTDKEQGSLFEAFGRQQIVMLTQQNLSRVINELTSMSTDN